MIDVDALIIVLVNALANTDSVSELSKLLIALNVLVLTAGEVDTLVAII